MKNKKIVFSIVIGLVIVSLSFYGGMMYSKSKNVSNSFSKQGAFSQNIFGQNSGRAIGMRNQAGGGLISGEIISKDDKSVTVKLRDGGSKIVFFSPSTQVEKMVDGSINDVIIGKQITIVGTTNTDGSVSATSIQMRPVMTNNVPNNQ